MSASDSSSSQSRSSAAGGGNTIVPVSRSLTPNIQLAYAMAGLNAVGGVIAYSARRSVRSLAAGGLFAGAFAVAAHWMSHEQELRGLRFSLLNSVWLSGLMGMRFWKTRKPMPAGALAAIGAASAVYNGITYVNYEE